MTETSETKPFALKLVLFRHLFFTNTFGLGECKIHLVDGCYRKLLFNKEEQIN